VRLVFLILIKWFTLLVVSFMNDDLVHTIFSRWYMRLFIKRNGDFYRFRYLIFIILKAFNYVYRRVFYYFFR